MLTDIDLITIRDPLLHWFSHNARTLPWRENPSAYRVWVSEIMLQQTRVEAVKPYFERFIQALPDVAALALCEEERLLKLWEGLGYYNRVRNMKEAAQTVMECYDGVIPSDYETLCTLKGIGSYTAGAIASIAYGRKVPAVDGNVLRIMTRLSADDTDIAKQPFKRQVEQALLPVMPDDAGKFNQALMELGAIVCTPNGKPDCAHCPWESMCLAHRSHRETDFPVKAKKKERTIEKKTVLLIKDGERVLITKRPEKGLLAGLYEFPTMSGYVTKKQALKETERLGLLPLRIEPLPDAKHVFTHKEWHMKGYLIRVAGSEECRFFTEPNSIETNHMDVSHTEKNHTTNDDTEKNPIRTDSVKTVSTGTTCEKKEYLLAEKKELEKTYPIPSAYAAYKEVAVQG